MATDKSYLNPKWLYDLSKIGEAGALPLKNDDDLRVFYDTVKNDANLGNSASGLLNIINNNAAAADQQTFVVNAEYYYKVYSSLLTREYHDNLAENNGFFKGLKKYAFEAKKNRHMHLNEVQNTAQNATDNWQHTSEELRMLYNRLRGNRNHEYINLIDDNSTLQRQRDLSNDLFIRRKNMNQFLRVCTIFLCLLILTGYMRYNNFNMAMLTVANLIIFVLFGITIIAMILKADRMHRLDANRLRFKGWPVLDKMQQAKYTGNCGIDEGNDQGETHCPNKR